MKIIWHLRRWLFGPRRATTRGQYFMIDQLTAGERIRGFAVNDSDVRRTRSAEHRASPHGCATARPTDHESGTTVRGDGACRNERPNRRYVFNPSTGLPMPGGSGGLDLAGHRYGHGPDTEARCTP